MFKNIFLYKISLYLLDYVFEQLFHTDVSASMEIWGLKVQNESQNLLSQLIMRTGT